MGESGNLSKIKKVIKRVVEDFIRVAILIGIVGGLSLLFLMTLSGLKGVALVSCMIIIASLINQGIESFTKRIENGTIDKLKEEGINK